MLAEISSTFSRSCSCRSWFYSKQEGLSLVFRNSTLVIITYQLVEPLNKLLSILVSSSMSWNEIRDDLRKETRGREMYLNMLF